MITKHKILLTTITAICIFTAYSQNGVYVVNERREPVAGALVCVMNVEHGSLLRSVVTDSIGYAEMNQVNFEKEVLKIMAFGYKVEDILSMPSGDVPTVELSLLEVELGEIVVNAASIVTQKSDRLIFHLANENITRGNSSFNILRFTPMIVINDANKISMIGKSGVLLYINGRKTNLPESSIRSYLETLPAERIASIEVITDPGATVRTGGNEGIINIVLKKNEADGLNGRLTFTDGQRKNNSQEGGLFLNFQKNKLNMSASISARNQPFDTKLIYDFYYISSNQHQSLISRDKSNNTGLQGSIIMDYNLSSKQVIGLIFNGSYNEGTSTRSDRTSFGRRFEFVVDSVIQSNNHIKSPIRNYSVNLNYRLKINEKENLSIDVDYLRNEREQVMKINFASVEQGTKLPPYDSFKQNSEDILNGYSGKVEYRHSFDAQSNITFGADVYSNSSNADFFYGILQNENYVSDPQKTNSFSYKESYAGAYVSFSRAWSPKFNSRIEARAEYFDSKGIQKVTSEEIKRNYIDVFPALSLQYQINPANRISYNFSSYASRPGYYSLNPFRFYLTPTTYKEYNPNRKQANLFNNTLNYALKSRYIFNVSYLYIKDCTNNFLVPVDEQYTKYINANYGSLYALGISFVWNQSFWDNRFFVNSSLQGDYRKSKGSVESIVVDVSSFSSSFSFAGNILLSKRYRWNLTSLFSYSTSDKLAHENSAETYFLSIGLKKNFHSNITLDLGVQNLLFNNPKSSKINSNYEYYMTPKYDVRTVFIGISIPFGNMKAKGAGTRNVSSREMKGRLKE